MKLYIAEKPSLARAIAAALPKPHKKEKHAITLGNGDVVTWCIGHILEQAQPEDYDQNLKKWRMETLPIIPAQWQLKPKSKTRAQLTAIRKLVKQASQIIHAGDPDREGQLLVDEVLHHLNVPQQKLKNTQRLLISDLNLPAVKRALSQIKSNQEFVPLSVSALARSRADWLYGINLTRAYTLKGQKSGYNGVLSVGRVQTPLLGLVVNRDKDIENFTAKHYYQVHAQLSTASNEKFIAKWQPSEACAPYMDDKGRILNKALAQNVVKRITDQPAQVTHIEQKEKRQNAPLPYNLSSLQIDAAKRFSMNAKLVLDVCQTLYEKHKLITYPRSDCRFLPNEQHGDAAVIIKQLSATSHPLADAAKQADIKIKSKAWNTKKVTAHHAIIPTEKCLTKATLNPFEANIYQLIMRQYLVQFFPAFIYLHTQVIIEIAGGNFGAVANVTKQLGWKSLFPKSTKNSQRKDDLNDDTLTELPNLTQGEQLHCHEGNLLEKTTQPPAYFTDATLLAAMTGISQYVQDNSIKKILKDTDGLGTEATRAGIIDLLFKRQFLQRSGKTITATQVGKALIDALPEQATRPDMTAQWEATLNAISEQRSNYQSFMKPLESTIFEMISDTHNLSFSQIPQQKFKPKRKKFTRRKKASNN